MQTRLQEAMEERTKITTECNVLRCDLDRARSEMIVLRDRMVTSEQLVCAILILLFLLRSMHDCIFHTVTHWKKVQIRRYYKYNPAAKRILATEI